MVLTVSTDCNANHEGTWQAYSAVQLAVAAHTAQCLSEQADDLEQGQPPAYLVEFADSDVSEDDLEVVWRPS
ncbi:hypothetical protein AWC25_20950 [Mycobacterium sherrisii]|uniref:Uncharacterized protein n=1 Tax=Mycobacterium sherrisii TaxID=243061 RepID=A0A1E3SVP5_9MYCO|nr:hypothetical protein BHQ21_11935 [Mycobacterium sherrisii]ORW86005.1 hypothetical protein AWC25_20950 [Mycobacterium sherrisii]